MFILVARGFVLKVLLRAKVDRGCVGGGAEIGEKELYREGSCESERELLFAGWLFCGAPGG